MSAEDATARPLQDSGLRSLILIAQFHSIAAEPRQLQHEFGVPGSVFGDQELLRAAKAISLKAKVIKTELARLSNSVLPAIAKSTDGTYFVLARVPEEASAGSTKVLIHDVRESAPRILSYSELDERWTGELILLSPRGLAGGASSTVFGFGWFVPALIKYRRFFGEVLVASFFSCSSSL